MHQWWNQNRDFIAYGFSAATLLVFLRIADVQLVFIHDTFAWYAGVIAVIFGSLGIWGALTFTKPLSAAPERQADGVIFLPETETLAAYNISKRELEVLGLMAKGYSNAQIAGKLFVSTNTVKTHASRIFAKLDVQRRTHAVDRARNLRLIP